MKICKYLTMYINDLNVMFVITAKDTFYVFKIFWWSSATTPLYK